jgi:methyl-accepting chemotaxis protein
MFKIKNTSVSVRLTLLIVSALLGMAALATVFLFTERQLILDERRSNVQQSVETAAGIASHFEALERQGSLPREQAQQQAKAAIRGLRYGAGDYFWVQDLEGQMLMHPIQPQLDGQNMSGNRDPDGKLFFQEMIEVAKQQGAGFVSYQWPKPGSDSPQPKVSYVKRLPGWDWIIGSGIYVDNVNATLAERAAGMAAGGLVLMAIVLALGLLIARTILRQLGGEPDYVAGITRRIAAGDLSAPIEIKYPGQENLLTGLQTMRDQLAAVVSQVRQGSENLASASAQIAQGNLDLSSRTEHQASALEETSASMEELGSTVRQNSDNARQANQLAQSASEIAVKGGAMVAQVVDTMKGINDSSHRIAAIIGVIDGIAFQTNILALNASVEAARAGEQGRGFAVVAAEVRSLAVRSAEAAREIKGLITTSVDRVEQGSVQVDQAGATMSEVVAGIKRVTDIMAEISTASAEQSSGVVQVGEAVMQMDQATQQNAALVEQMAAAASSLKDQARELVQTVSVFKLGHHAVGAGLVRSPSNRFAAP